MYKMIIADDEKIIREGLAEIIDWQALGFEITGIFSDGDEVMEYLDTHVCTGCLSNSEFAL